MTESTTAGGVAAPCAAASAGSLLRAARERQGLHVAALAAAIKVPPQRLEALEADRIDELPDVAFARALAQAVCRTLKTDAQPVLALLPAATDPHRLARIGGGLNTPFIGRPGRDDPAAAAWWARPAVWAPALVLLVAALVYLLPDGWLAGLPDGVADGSPAGAQGGPTPAVSGVPQGPAAGGGSAPALAVPVPVPVPVPPSPGPAAPAAVAAGATPAAVETVHLAPPVDAASAPAALLWLRASEPSWVEIRDGTGRVLLARTLQAGESLSLDGGLPLRLTVGNAAATTVSLRGRAVDVAAVARDNVARLTLE